MTRITIEVPDDVAERMNAAAAERGVATERLLSEVAAQQFPPRRKLGFIGLGHSGRSGQSKNLKALRREVAQEKYQQMLDERRPAEG
ncbi:MAG: hypothetical protein NVS3B12_28640 [Acidimicrobiales bacterium]